ncbi:MAG: cytochrome P450 [Polyangiaceae bacterium]
MTTTESLPPGPKMWPILQSASWVFRPISYLESARAQFGDTFTMQLAGLPRLVILSNPSDIKEVFTGDPEVFHAGSANIVLRPILGKSSLLLLDGERHMQERRLMMPAFHGERMQAYARVMREAADRAIERWPTDPRATFSFHREMQDITLDVILRAVFGVEEGATKARLRDALVRMLSFGEHPGLLLLVGPEGTLRWQDLHDRLGRLSPWASFKRVIDQVDALILHEIRARRASAAEGEDVLSLLLAARDPEGRALDDEALVSEMKTLLVAGHETTATALTWTMLELLQHPAALEKLRRELASGGDVYAEAVVRESLRLHPVVPLVGRKLMAPATVGGRRYPAGTVLAPSIWLTQRNPAVWKDPDRFDPERFVGWKPNPYDFLPFGGGVRRCIGLAFALFEMKEVLARILERTRLELAPGYRPKLVRRGITFAVAEGLPVRQLPRPN